MLPLLLDQACFQLRHWTSETMEQLSSPDYQTNLVNKNCYQHTKRCFIYLVSGRNTEFSAQPQPLTLLRTGILRSSGSGGLTYEAKSITQYATLHRKATPLSFYGIKLSRWSWLASTRKVKDGARALWLCSKMYFFYLSFFSIRLSSF